MNKVYKCIWNASLGTWVAVSELASSKKKTKSTVNEIDRKSEQKATSKNILLVSVTALTFALSSVSFAATKKTIVVTDTGESAELSLDNKDIWHEITHDRFKSQMKADGKFSAKNAIEIGVGSKAEGGSLAIGSQATALDSLPGGTYSMASTSVGTAAVSYGGGVALGSIAAAATNAVAIGRNAVANEGGVAVGRGAGAAAKNSLAFGYKANAKHENAVAIGGESTTEAANTVSFGNDKLQRTLTNVNKGKISADSVDAVNGSQIYNSNKSVADALGGGSKVDDAGNVTAPTYTVGGKEVKSVGDAITNVDGRVAGNTNSIDSITKTLSDGAFSVSANGGEKAMVKKDATIDYTNKDGNIKISNSGTNFQFDLANQLTVKDGIKIGEKGPSISTNGIDAAGTVISNIKDGVNAGDAVSKGQLDKSLVGAGIVDKDGKAISAVTYDKDGNVALTGKDGSLISNVAAGKISADSKDAVNGSQLFATNENVTTNTNQIKDLNKTLSEGAFSVSANGKDATKVGKDATIDYTNKDGNITISNSGTNFQFDLANQLTVKDGIKIGDKGPSISTKGIDAAGTVISNIKDGVNAGDAVSKGQLDKSLVGAGIVDKDGKAISAVTYDKDGNVALTGKDGSLISNVAAGKISADSKDAVNGSQLFATNENVTTNTNQIKDLNKTLSEGAFSVSANGKDATKVGKDATIDYTNKDGNITISNSGTNFQFDLANQLTVKDGIKIGEKGPSISTNGIDAANKVISNVGAGTVGAGSNDAVTGDQLFTSNEKIKDLDAKIKDSGLIGNDGKAINAVTYDKDGNVALTGKDGSVISNVAAGKISANSKDAVNGSQIYNSNKSVADALGGGSTVDKNGNVTTPTYTVGGKEVTNLGDAITNVDKSITNVDSRVTNITETLDQGAFSVSANGKGATKVEKDATIDYTNKDGNITISNSGTNFQFDLANQLTVKDGIKIGDKGPSISTKGIDAAGTVISNIKDGVNAGDAVSKGQLDKSLVGAGIVDKDGKAISAVTYDKDGNVALTGKDGSLISNVAAGKISADSKDAVNGSQIYNSNKSVADALGGGSTVDKNGNVTTPTYTVGGKEVTNLGDAITNVDKSITNVDSRVTNITETLDQGAFSVSANGKGATKVEKDATIDYTNKDGNITISNSGTNFQFDLANQLTVKDGIKIGDKGPSISTNGIDAANKVISNVGAGTVGAGSNDAVTGDQLFTSNEKIKDLDAKIKDSGLIGDDGKAINAVTYDKDGNVALTGKDGSLISNVAAGKISADSKDAVNGSQIYNSNKSVADALGGNSTVDKNGNVTTPTYTVGGKEVKSVGDAITNVDGRVTGNTNSIDSITKTLSDGAFSVSANGGDKAKVKKDATIDYANKDGNIKITNSGTNFQFDLANQLTVKDGIKIGDKGPSISTNGIDAANKVISNVGAGTVGAGSNDAVTGDQLFTSNEKIKDLDAKIKDSGLIGDDGKAINAVTYDKDGNVALTGKDGSLISNVAAGKISADSKDAVNGSQIYNSNKSVADALGGNSTVDKNGNVTTPTYTVGGKEVKSVGDAITNVDGRVTGNTNSIDSITKTLSDGAFSVSANGGEKAKVVKDATIDYTSKDGNIKISNSGTNFQFDLANQLTVKDGIKIGEKGPSISTNGIDAANKVISNVGAGTVGAGSNDAVTGDQLFTSNERIKDLDAKIKDSGLIGDDGKAINAVTYDKDGNVALTGKDGSVISNVAAGKISADSKDAVNGSQIYNSNKSVADALGGGSTVDKNGNVTAPTYTVGGKEVTNLGDAITNVDKSITNVDSRVTNITETLDQGAFSVSSNGKDETKVKVEKDATIDYTNTDGNITISNSGTNFQFDLADQLTVKDGIKIGDKGPSISTNGIDAANKVISNVGAGTVGAGSNDAVTGDQLFTSNEKIKDLDAKIKDSGLIGDDGKAINAVTYDKDGNVALTGKDGSLISNVAAGKISADSKDAVNGSQIYNSNKSVADALGGNSTVDKNGNVTTPTYTVGGKEVTNLGDAITNVDKSITNVDSRVTNITETLDQGAFSVSANGKGATKVEKDATIDYTNKDGNIKISNSGTNFQFDLANQLTVKDGIKIGDKGPSISTNGIDAAGTVISNIKDGVNAGDAVSKGQLDKSLVGAGIVDKDGKAISAVTYDKDGNVALTGKDGSVISNVAAGTISADSKDAVNGSQIYNSNKSVADALGGGSTVDKNGNVTTPTYTVGGKEVKSVGDAITNVDGRVTGNTNSIDSITKTLSDGAFSVSANGGEKAKVVKDATIDYTSKDGNIKISNSGTNFQFDLANQLTVKDGIKIGEKGPSISTNGIDAANKVISNVGAGTVGAGSNDAVTGDQLFTSNERIKDLDAKIKDSGLIGDDGKAINAVTYDKDGNVALTGKDGSLISNVAAGTISADSKDAVNGSQIYNSNKSVADALGGGSTVDKNGNVTTPTYTVGGKEVTNLGDAITNVDKSITNVDSRVTNITETLDQGAFSVSSNGKDETKVKVEKDATIDYTNKDGNIKISNSGTNFQFDLANQLTVKDGIKIGDKGPSISTNGIDAAGTVISNIKDGVNAGDAVSKGQLDKSLVGAGIVDKDGKAISAVTYDKDGNVALTGKDGSVISNVAAGTISADSKDAVNGSQIYNSNKSVADALGGGSTVDKNGNVTAPTYTVGGKEVTNLGDAITNVDKSITNVDSRVTNITETLDQGAFSVSSNGKDETKVKVEKDATIDYTNKDGNIKISNSGTNFQFDLANQLTVKEGIKIGDKGPSISTNGIDAAGTVISNIKDGVNAGDAVSKGQLDKSLVGAGIVDKDGKAISAVTYDKDGNVALTGKDGSLISNVAAGTISADSKDAVNGSQIYNSNKSVADALGGNSTVDKNGNVTAPTYTVGGKEVTNLGDAITNVDKSITNVDSRVTNITETLDQGAFSVSSNGKDETKVKVEKDATIDYTNKDGNIKISNSGTNFQFDLANQLTVKDGIKIGDKGPSISTKGIDAAGTVISNIKDGVNAGDAVSKGQLDKSLVGAGIVDKDGKAISAVTYDKDGNIALTGKDGSLISNVAAGTISADSKDAVNGSQIYNSNKSVADALGGNSTVDKNGNVTAPTYTVGGKEVTNLGDAITNVDGRVTNITETLEQGAFSVSANGKGATKVEKDAIIDYTNTDGNIKISNSGTDFQFNLADQIVVKDRITVGTDGPSISKDGIDLAGTVISNVGAGTVGAGSKDAVTGDQLFVSNEKIKDLSEKIKDSGLVDSAGKVINAVTYDKDGNVALKGKDGKASLISNVAAGTISADSKDAVNGSQLFATNENVTTNTNQIKDLNKTLDQGAFNVSANGKGATKVGKGATIDYTSKDGNIKISNSGTNFQFDLANQLTVKDGIKIGDKGPSISTKGIDAAGTIISNIKDGVNANDAVSKGQLDKSLKDIGILDEDGKLANVVTYDENGKVSLSDNAGQGSTLTNVAKGKITKDSRDAINGSQLFTSNENFAKALGGGAMLDSNGNLVGPNYKIGGQVFTNIGGALSNIDGRVNTMQDQVNNISAKSEGNVSYAVDSKGKVNKNELALAGDKAETAKDSKGNTVVTSGGTTISNVANGVTASDAVNKGQLDKTLSDAKDYTDQRINDATNGMSEDITNVKNDVNNIKEGKDGMFQVNTKAPAVKPQATAENTLAGGSGAKANAENAVALGNNAVAKGKNSVALGQGSVADRENTVSVGSDGKERQITNVAAGTKATDAVNVAQLNDVKSTLAETQDVFTQQINDTNRYVYNVDKHSRAGIAGVSAMANIPQVMAGGQKSLGVGVGSYRGQNAIAVGGSLSSDDGKWVFKGSAAFNSQDKSTVGAGVSRVW